MSKQKKFFFLFTALSCIKLALTVSFRFRFSFFFLFVFFLFSSFPFCVSYNYINRREYATYSSPRRRVSAAEAKLRVYSSICNWRFNSQLTQFPHSCKAKVNTAMSLLHYCRIHLLHSLSTHFAKVTDIFSAPVRRDANCLYYVWRCERARREIDNESDTRWC